MLRSLSASDKSHLASDPEWFSRTPWQAQAEEQEPDKIPPWLKREILEEQKVSVGSAEERRARVLALKRAVLRTQRHSRTHTAAMAVVGLAIFSKLVGF